MTFRNNIAYFFRSFFFSFSWGIEYSALILRLASSQWCNLAFFFFFFLMFKVQCTNIRCKPYSIWMCFMIYRANISQGFADWLFVFVFFFWDCSHCFVSFQSSHTICWGRQILLLLQLLLAVPVGKNGKQCHFRDLLSAGNRTRAHRFAFSLIAADVLFFFCFKWNSLFIRMNAFHCFFFLSFFFFV